ncbi:hypothetical protein CH370_05990 [Leptospira kmetyi]|nr:hypothetical protein CH370_05990 [Leptospira kmetyi]
MSAFYKDFLWFQSKGIVSGGLLFFSGFFYNRIEKYSKTKIYDNLKDLKIRFQSNAGSHKLQSPF